MTRFSTQIKIDLDYPQKYATEQLKHNLGMGILEKIFEDGRDVICISPIKAEEFPEFDYRPSITKRWSVDINYVQRVPVYMPGGYFYQDIRVIPPNELTWKERIKFLFTGKYPK
jgi:hypothetical protein